MGFMTKVRHYYGAYRLTLSGDISVSSGSPTVLYELMGERREAVQNIIQEILERYPFLKIDIKDGITETEISFFSYDAAMDDASFLDNFKADLLRLARYLDEGGKASVTINFSGVICQVQDRQRFRMLNKGLDIQYKITAHDRINFVSGLTHSRFFRIFETALIIFLLFYISYDALSHQIPAKLA
jgi:hypothetical protein